MAAVMPNELSGTRAVLRHCRMSATKAREVLDLIRGKDVQRAGDILRFSEREAARVVAKVLGSAVANASHNDFLDAEELFVSACYADEGTTVKRWRPRARGRATRIRKRTCHITVVVSRLPEERLTRQRERRIAEQTALRARRAEGGRRRGRRSNEEELLESPSFGADPAEASETEVVEEEPEETLLDAEDEEQEEGAAEEEPTVQAEAAEDDAEGQDAEEAESSQGAQGSEEG